MDCVFCKICNGEIPSNTIYEDEYVKVIMDIHPSINGHMLVIPKKHFEDLMSIDDEYLLHVNNAAKIVSKKALDKLNVKGLSLSINYGDKQDVKHYHLHVLPNDKNKIGNYIDYYEKLK